MTASSAFIAAVLGALAWVFAPLVGVPVYLIAIGFTDAVVKSGRSAGFLFPSRGDPGIKYGIQCVMLGIVAAAVAGVGIPVAIAAMWQGREHAVLAGCVAAASLACPYVYILVRGE